MARASRWQTQGHRTASHRDESEEPSPPDPYVQPQQPNPYGGPPAYGQPAFGQRALGSIIDGLLTVLASLPLLTGYGILFVPATASRTMTFSSSERHDRQDPDPWCRTGQLLRVLHLQPGQPIGAGMSFVRPLVHVLDGLCYLGYLWPLWDSKRQTFGDKALSTVVVNQPAGR